MRNNIPPIIIYVLALGAIIYLALQLGENTKLKEQVTLQSDTIQVLQAQNAQQQQALDTLRAALDTAEAEIGRLSDDIGRLNRENQSYRKQIAELRQSLEAQNKALGNKQAEIGRLQKNLQDAEARIAELLDAQSMANKSGESLQLEREKQGLLRAIDEMSARNHALQDEVGLLRRQVGDTRTAIAQVYEQNADAITLRTAVQSEVRARCTQVQLFDRYRNKLSRIDGSNPWHSTTLLLGLEAQQPQLILGRRFSLRIKDLDRGTYVPLNEGKGDETDSYLNFDWQGQPLSLDYVNYGKKEGKNYAFQVFFLDEEGQHLIHNSHLPFISQGKLLQ